MPSTKNQQQTRDIHEEKAMLLVEQLLEKETIKMQDDEPLLHHVPSGAKFESAVNMAHFHDGWKAREKVDSN